MSNIVFISCSAEEDLSKARDKKSDPLVLHENVKIIDANILQLDLNPEKIKSGVYEFTGSTDRTKISVGDVVVGEQGDGFLRKVKGVSESSGKITLLTTQGTLKDLFKSGQFKIDLSDATSRQSQVPPRANITDGITYTIPSTTLYNQGGLNLTLDSGYTRFYPNWVFDFQYDDEEGYTDGLEFKMLSENGRLDTNFKITGTSTGVSTLANQDISLLTTPYVRRVVRWVPATLLLVPVIVPVVFIINVDLRAQFNATSSSATSRSATFTSNSSFTFGIKYENSAWSAPYSFNQTNSVALSPWTSNANLNITAGIGPVVSVRLYGLAGPHASIGMASEFDANVSLVTNNWDVKADAWLKASAGIDATILGTAYNYEAPAFETEKISYITPFKIDRISGNNQIGPNGQVLPQALKVRVLDNFNIPVSGVKVNFANTTGGGSVSPSMVLSDQNGYAQTNWTLGPTEFGHEVQVTVKKADGTNITTLPLTFNATTAVGQWYVGTYTYGSPEGSYFNTFPHPQVGQTGQLYIYRYRLPGAISATYTTYFKSISSYLPNMYNKVGQISAENPSTDILQWTVGNDTHLSTVRVLNLLVAEGISITSQGYISDALGNIQGYGLIVTRSTLSTNQTTEAYAGDISLTCTGTTIPAGLTTEEQNILTNLINPATPNPFPPIMVWP